MPDTEALIEQARQSLRQFNYMKAVYYADLAIKKSPKKAVILPWLYEIKATAFEREARFGDALDAIEEYFHRKDCAGAPPDDVVPIVVMKANILDELQKVESAFKTVQDFQDGLGKARLSPENRALLDITTGALHSHIGNQEKAEKTLTSALNRIEKLADEPARDRLLAQAYGELALVRFRQGRLDDTQELCDTGINKIKEEFNLVKAEIYRHKAVVLSIKYEYVGAVECHSRSMRIYKRMGHTWGLMKEYISLGLTYLNMGELDLAELFFQKAQKIAENCGDEAPQAILYSRLGHLYMNKGDYEKSLFYHLKDLEIARRFENKYVTGFPLRNVGRIMRLNGNADQAVPLLKESIKLFREVKDEINIATSAMELVQALLDVGEHNESMEMVKEAGRLFLKHGQDSSIAQADLITGIIHTERQEWDAAEKRIREAIRLYEKYENQVRLADAYFHMGNMYLKAKEAENAIVYFTRSLKIATELGNRKLAANILNIFDELDEYKIVDHSIHLFRKHLALEKENLMLRRELDLAHSADGLIGASGEIQKIRRLIKDVAPSNTTVFIRGESGTGKELVARAIHHHSNLKDRPLVLINCGAIPRELVESELFGHKKGAFTGAVADKKGKLAAADGGTVFLDEIGDLPRPIQSRLLRFLQEGEIQELGTHEVRQVVVRVIAATNKNLEMAMSSGDFRQDLFFRLNVFPINIPPLRERREDIPALAEFFLRRYASEMNKDIQRISKSAASYLKDHHWPGNVRELRNCIERAVLVCRTDTIMLDDIVLHARDAAAENPQDMSLAAVEKKHILNVLKISSGNREKAAALLGIHRNTLRNKLIQYDLQ